MRLWRGLAKVALYLDSDGDGDVDHRDFLDADRDGTSDLIGLLLMIIKMMTVALCFLLWNSIRVTWKLKQQKKNRTRELLIFACSPKLAQLPNAVVEATEVSRVFDASIYARGNVTAKELRSALLSVPTRRFLFIGHTDAPIQSAAKNIDNKSFADQSTNGTNQNEKLLALSFARHGPRKPPSGSIFGCRTLGFVTQEGHLSAVIAADLAQLLGRHGLDRGGDLELVFLNGCKSEPLARAVCDAGVPLVVCWKTKAHDAAARLFSKAFFDALSHFTLKGNQRRRRFTFKQSLVSYVRAFREAVDSIRFETRPGTLANGVQANVPKFEIRDPNEATDIAQRACLPHPVPAGVPWLVSSRPIPENCLSLDQAGQAWEKGLAPLFESLRHCRRRKSHSFLSASRDKRDIGDLPPGVDTNEDGDVVVRSPSAQLLARTFGAGPSIQHRSEIYLLR